MNSLKGKWGLYPWFVEIGEEKIDSADLDSFKELGPYGKVFHCEDIDSKYICIRYGDMKYKVKPELFKVVDKPDLIFGEKVIIKGKQVEGRVKDIQWHHEKSKACYFLIVNGKKKSTRYFKEDLEKVID